MNINNDNYRQFTYLVLVMVAISAAVVYLISCSLQSYNIAFPFYIEIPSIPGVYALIFCIFDTYLWRMKIFKKWGIIVADDLRGKWIGTIKSSYDGFGSDKQIELNIEQTATHIKIHGTFEQSKSISVHENFGKSEIDNKVALFYFFRNEPQYNATPTMAIHEGSTKLVYNKEIDTLEGYYYSGRDRNTYGTIIVKRQK